MLIVRTLGALEILLAGRPLRFKMSKAAVLLVYLMQERDKTHGREQLATLLWPEESDHKSRENFRQALYQIRRALGEQTATYLHITPTTLQFIPSAPHQFDAYQFEQAIAQRDWQQAAELYRGEFLATIYPDNTPELAEWQLMTREHLHQLAVQCLTQLARQTETADPLKASQYARRLLALEPWAEAGHRLLMRCWARQGNLPETLAQYQQCAQILAEQLGATPTPKTTALYEQLRDGRWQATPAPRPPAQLGQLPATLTPLVGRDEALAELRQLLAQPDCRLLNITGVGGIGKTKLLLALGWACHHAQSYADGVLFASLAEVEPSLSEQEPVAEQIAHHLVRLWHSSVVETSTAQARELLYEAWHGRELLLLLDNWEHLLAGATLLTDLLTHLPRLTIATTSRVPLNLHGEWLYPLQGLSLVGGDQGAVQLFAQAARRVQPHFMLDPSNRDMVATLCRTLEGHPLALEMAAAALRGLTLSELLAEVTTGLDVLTTNQPNIPARQREMRHLLAASWSHLTPAEQNILCLLSLFRQPFTAAAAQAVGGARVGQMAALVAQAWLRRTADGRYQTHELLRHFAREQLGQTPALAPIAPQKYAAYHLQWLAQWADQPLTAPMLAELTASWADVTLAWEEGVRQQMWGELVGAVPTLRAFYEHKGLLGEGIIWLAMAEKGVRNTAVVSPALRLRALLLIEQANLRNTQVQSAPVPDLMAQAITLAEQIGDGELRLLANMALVRGLGRLGRLEETIRLGLTLLQQTDPAPTPVQQAALHMTIGTTYSDSGALALAEQYLRRAIVYYEQAGAQERAMSARHNLTVVLAQQGAYAEARRLLIQNLLFCRQHPSPPNWAVTYEGLGVVSIRLGRVARGEWYLHKAEQLYTQLGDEDGLAYVALHRGRLALAQGGWRQAEGLFARSAEIRQRLNPRLVVQPWAGLAMAAWRGGNTAVAHTYFAKLLPLLLANEVEGEEIGWLYEVATQLAQEMGHPQAEQLALAGAGR